MFWSMQGREMSCSDSPSSLRFITTNARASLHLRLATWSNNGDGRLRDVEAVLAEDNRSVVIYATHKDGRTLWASFEIAGADYGRSIQPGRIRFFIADETEAETDGKTES
jgi:hypothetical protein